MYRDFLSRCREFPPLSGLLDYGTVDLGYHYPSGTQSVSTLWGRVDITPPPYNLPPYQPSGGTAIDTFIFTGIEPGGGTAGD